MLGTTDYVSPEQALGHAVDGQSDLYSLGVVLFEMLTGDVPFHGENQVAVAMKHVREEVPDVQLRRPEVSSALASVVDRMTAKDLGVRYASAAALIADLEEVLMIEVTRSGQATGEATTILRTLPEPRRERLPLRMRTPIAVMIALLVAGGVAVAAILVLAAGSAERGTGTGRGTPPAAPGTEVVSLGQKAVSDFDPQGDHVEHAGEATFVLDKIPSTFWSTETYLDGNLGLKEGVGIYVDARPSAAGRALEIETPTPGFTATIYGASSGPPEELADWTRLSAPVEVGSTERIELDAADQRFRFYLVWITEFGEGDERARISELRLLAER